jgi:hypothetical protein
MDWNTVHYKTVEQPRNRVTHWWQRHGRPWVRTWQRWRETTRQAQQDRETARPTRKERHRMPSEIERVALFKAMLPQLDEDFLALLKDELRDSLVAELMPEAEATARAALEAEYERRDEQRLDALAAYKRQAQADCELELETVIARERATLQRESEGEMDGLRDDLREAQQRATAAETALLAVWRQLLPQDQRVYLFDSGVLELDLTTLNPVLQRAGQVQIAYQQATTSTRLVKLKVGEAHYAAAAKFWLEPTEPTATRSSGGLVDPAVYR